MQADKMEGLLREIGLGDRMRVISKDADTNFMFKCPFHGERNPSAGISAEKEYGACFTCGKGFNLTFLVAYMKEISIVKAKDYLEEKFNVSKKSITKLALVKRYDDEEVKMGKVVLPYFKLAPYRSGKVVHNYLLDRGFTKETCREFMFGWDSDKNRITIPIFWGEKQLAGFIGRAVLEPKINGVDNPEYKSIYRDADKYLVYEFQKSHLLYPLHKFILPPDKSVILVEGSLDAVWLHQMGFRNVLAILGSKISDEQIAILHKLGVKIIYMFLDNDKAGFEGKEKLYKLCKRDFRCYDVFYEEGKNDPAQLDSDEVMEMINNRKSYSNFSIKRVE